MRLEVQSVMLCELWIFVFFEKIMLERLCRCCVVSPSKIRSEGQVVKRVGRPWL